MPSNITKKLREIIGISYNNELVASAEIALSDRIASPFYGYFLISWVILNWRIIYAAFFIDQSKLLEKTGLLRNEYIQTLMPMSNTLNFYVQFIVEPILLTILILWIFPYGTRIFFRQYLKNKVALKIIELEELRKEKKEEKALAQEETELIKSEIERAKVEKMAAKENPEVLWVQEYYQFKILPLYKRFHYIIESIYEHGSAIVVNHPYDNVSIFQIPREILAYSHTNNLVIFDKTKEKIELTEKGKFFVRKFSTETSA